MIDDAMKTVGLQKQAVKNSLADKTSVVTHLAEVNPAQLCGALNKHMLGARVLTTGRAGGDAKAEGGPRGVRALLDQLSNAGSLLSRVLLAAQAVTFLTAIISELVWETELVAEKLLVVVVLLGHALLRRALLSVLACRVSIQLLMFIVMAGAIVLDKLHEAATVSLAVSASEWVVGRVHALVEAAMSRSLVGTATHASRLGPAGESLVPIGDLRPRDVVLLKTGESVPTDGCVRRSEGLRVDESAVTGEALHVEKPAGAKLLSGVVVVGGACEMECTATAEDSFQGQMRRAVDEARGSRSEMDEMVNRVAAWYTPLVVVGAVLVAVLTGKPLRGLAALVSACPCALVAAAPVVQACTIVKLLTDRQVLVKNAKALESLARLEVLAVDKTGTLTEGQFELADAQIMPAASDRPQAELLRLLAAVESKDPHPLASSLVRAHVGCASRFDQAGGANNLPRVTNFTRVESMGVWGMVGGEVVGAGSAEFVADMGIIMPAEAVRARESWEASGCAFTAVYMTIEDDVVMALCLQDIVRPDAAAAVEWFTKFDIRTVMLTGDAQRAADLVGREVGIAEVHAALKPMQKEAWIAAVRAPDSNSAEPAESVAEKGEEQSSAPLLRRGRRGPAVVGMLGDGLNDSPALAAADVGVAISSGLQLTVDAADVVVSNNGSALLNFSEAVQSARWCSWLVIANILIAVLVKVAALALAACGRLTLSMGVLVDVGSLLLVLANSLTPLCKPRSARAVGANGGKAAGASGSSAAPSLRG